MGQTVRKLIYGSIEIADLLPFRITVTFMCLSRHDIPTDIIRQILSQMLLIQNVAIINEAEQCGWLIMGMGTNDDPHYWQYQTLGHDFFLDQKWNVSEQVEYIKKDGLHRVIQMPRVFYTRSIRRQGIELTCLMCGKKTDYMPRIHPLLLCVDNTEKNCLNEFQRSSGCFLWEPSLK